MQKNSVFALYILLKYRGEKKMDKYGQAEYAYSILKQITEKLVSAEILTKKQSEIMNQLNKQDCFDKFCTVLKA